MYSSLVIKGLYEYVRQVTADYELDIDFVSGLHYAPNMTFDETIRKKLVGMDVALEGSKPWMFTIFSRDTIVESAVTNRTFRAINRSIPVSNTGEVITGWALSGYHHFNEYDTKMVSLLVNFGFISNSLTKIENLEELFKCVDLRGKFSILVENLGVFKLNFQGPLDFIVGIKGFSTTSFSKEDSQYGQVCQLTMSFDTEFNIVIPRRKVVSQVHIINPEFNYTELNN